MSKIDVSVKDFPSLFKMRNPLVIPDYQRPYVWGMEKTEELLNDLQEFFFNERKVSAYYMGSILLYRNTIDATYEIIDGQQRITTLLLMKYLLENHLDDRHRIKFNSYLSFKSIREAATFLNSREEILQSLYNEDFFNHLEFTVIITNTEDEAFTFFDTQNNRGVKLSATDFLKAYHLRNIESPHLQESSAIIWEKAQSIDQAGTFMNFMFDKVLWRARNWRGNSCRLYDNMDKQIRDTFQKDTHEAKEDSYPVFHCISNKKIEQVQWNDDGNFSAVNADLNQQSPENLPFTIRQPIYKGMNFFKYAEKYTAVYETLFVLESTSVEINILRDFYKKVYTGDMSEYLRHFMQLCLIFYFDNFGTNELGKAIWCFDYAIGSIRISKQQIKNEAPKKFLNENRLNLLDLISSSYLPDEVFKFIYQNERLESIYFDEEIEDGVGVQGRYKSRLKKYFGRTDETLQSRKNWII